MGDVANVDGTDNRESYLNLYILKLKISTYFAHILLINDPIDTYMVSQES